jgi:inorganic pyrophosphatase
MTNLLKLPTWVDEEHVFAVVETPRGSTCKLDFDPELRVFTLAKPLMAGLTYPCDWGFIPSTKAEDGDPLDILVLHDSRTYPGVVLRCRPVGILELEQNSNGKRERNDRVFAVPDRSPLETDLKDIRHLPPRAHEELEQFFRATNALESKELKSWDGGDPDTRPRRSSDYRFSLQGGAGCRPCPLSPDAYSPARCSPRARRRTLSSFFFCFSQRVVAAMTSGTLIAWAEVLGPDEIVRLLTPT